MHENDRLKKMKRDTEQTGRVTEMSIAQRCMCIVDPCDSRMRFRERNEIRSEEEYDVSIA